MLGWMLRTETEAPTLWSGWDRERSVPSHILSSLAVQLYSHPKPFQNKPRPRVPCTHMGLWSHLLGMLAREGSWAFSLEPRIGDRR